MVVPLAKAISETVSPALTVTVDASATAPKDKPATTAPTNPRDLIPFSILIIKDLFLYLYLSTFLRPFNLM